VQSTENIYSYFVINRFKVQSTVILIICLNKRENRTVRCTLKSVFLFFYKYYRYSVPVDLHLKFYNGRWSDTPFYSILLRDWCLRLSVWKCWRQNKRADSKFEPAPELFII